VASVINWPTIKIKDQVYTIKILFKEAYSLADKFNWNVIKLFLDDVETERAMMRILMDTEFVIDVLWFFIEDKFPGDKDKLLEILETSAGLDEFRDALWGAVVCFSSPQLKSILQTSWERLKKEIKKADADSIISTNSSSPLPPGESTSVD
jgi:hypothetical protein